MSLRIGMVCPYSMSTPGGVQAHALGLTGYLRGHGHQVSLLAPDVDAVSAGDRDAGWTVPVPWNGSIARVGMGPLQRARTDEWLAQGFDLVHVHEPLTPSVSFHVLGRATTPVVATFHTVRSGTRLHRAAADLFSRRMARITRGIAVSDAARELADSYVNAPVTVIPNGLCIADFRLADSAMVPRSIVFVGRDERRKGLEVLLTAAPELARRGWTVDVVGPAQRPGHPQVRFHGPVSDAERARILAGAAVFVAPHLHGESFGIVLAEAVAAGCRVVASDLEAFGWLADVGARVEYFETGSSTALVAATERSTRPPEPHPGAVEHLDWSVVGPAVEREYRAALG